MKEMTPDIQAYDPYLPDAVFEEAGVRRASLEEVLRSLT